MKNKTVAVYVSNPSRISDRNDQYDSFRGEGRIVINIGFGLGLLGFNVHIIYPGWSNDLRKVYKNVYLTNKPQLDYYDYALVFQNVPNSNSKYGTVIFMGYEHYSINMYNNYKNNINKNIIYTYPIDLNFDKIQLNTPFKIHYLPILFPIPSINNDGNFGFLPYQYKPRLPNLNIFMFFSSNSLSTDFNKVRFLDKEIFIINYLKNKGFTLNLNVLVERTEHINEFPIDRFVDKDVKNERQHKIKISFSNESSYMDIINYIKNSDICITVGGYSSANCIFDIISLGKPTIFIGDGIPEKKQTEIVRNAMYKYPHELLYIQESDKDSLIKIEKFISNPKLSYDKFKNAYIDYDFNNWKKFTKKIFMTNNDMENNDMENNDMENNDMENNDMENNDIENKNIIINENINITKEDLIQLIKHKPSKIENVELKSEIIPEHSKTNIHILNMNTNDSLNNSNIIYINEYWNLESLITEDNIIPLLECINMWKKLKIEETCYFDYNNTNLSSDRIEIIKNIFKESGFQYININLTKSEIIFKKLSITKIINWEFLKQIHELLDIEFIGEI